MKNIFVLTIIMITLTKVNSQNLLQNPSFETVNTGYGLPLNQYHGECAFGITSATNTAVTNWFCSQGTPQLFDNNYQLYPNDPSTYPVNSGNRATFFGNITEGIFQNVNTQAGKAYKLSFYAKGGSVNFKVATGLTHYTGGINSNTFQTPSSSLTIINSSASPSSYSLFTANFFPTNNYSQLWAYGDNNGDAYIDDISLVEIPGIIRTNGQSGLICSSTQFQAIAPSAYYNWSSPTGNLSISGSGNTVSVTPSGRGLATLCVATDKGTYCIDFLAGPPKILDATIDNNPLQTPNYVNGSGIMRISATGSFWTSWAILNGNGNIYPLSVSCQGNPNTFLQVNGTAINTCGNGDSRTFYMALEGTSMYRMASANPTNGIINVELVDPIVGEDLLKEAYIISENQKEKFVFDLEKSKKDKYFEKNKTFSIDISKASKGTMYLKMRIGDKDFTERLLKN